MTDVTAPLTVLGAGSWGTALALVLAHQGQPITLWSNEAAEVEAMQEKGENSRYLPGIPFPSNLQVSHDLSASVASADDILVVVPSYAFREVLQAIKPQWHDQKRLVWGTKGLDPETGHLLSSVAQEILGADVTMAVLSGPSFAREVAADLPTAVCIASKSSSYLTELAKRFHARHFRVYPSHDIVGLQLCGVVKNVIAIAVGMSDGRQFGANARAALITRGLVEMRRLCDAVGGDEKTVDGLAGLGDLILTASDDQSRNRRLGLALGQGVAVEPAIESIGQSVEGFYNARQIYELAQIHHVDMPIVSVVYRTLYENLSIEAAANTLLARDQASQE